MKISPFLLRIAKLSGPLWLAGATAHAACLASGEGDLAPLEALAFRAPAQAQPQIKALMASGAFQRQSPPQQAALWAIAADVARQLSQDELAVQQAQAGLAALAPDRRSVLALRLRAALVASGADNDQATIELDTALADAAALPLAQGCLLRDRGWRRIDASNLEGGLEDLIRAYALLSQHANRDEQVVTMGRLAVAYVNSGDYTAALALIDETIAHFRSTQAGVRLSTALQRRANALGKLKRLPEAEAAAKEAAEVSMAHGDIGGSGYGLVSQCRMAGAQDHEARALALCEEAERRLRAGAAWDANAQNSLALLRLEVLRSRAPNAAELAYLQAALVNAVESDAAYRARLHLLRARALASRAEYRAANADLEQVLHLQRTANEGERIKTQAALRVRFETDRALARSGALQEQNQRAKERVLWLAVAALGLLAAVAGLAYSLLLSRRHRQRLTEVAECDELTQLPNRRKIMAQAEQQFALARRRGGHLVVGMLDIDHFKRINDTHGHDGGDQVLRAIGAVAAQALRGTDLLGRWGGEEFLLLLPDCPWGDALQVADRLRMALAAHAVPHTPEICLRFSASIGLAAVEAADADLQTVLQRADAALYAAKAQGRDRVVVDAGAGVGAATQEASVGASAA